MRRDRLSLLPWSGSTPPPQFALPLLSVPLPHPFNPPLQRWKGVSGSPRLCASLSLLLPQPWSGLLLLFPQSSSRLLCLPSLSDSLPPTPSYSLNLSLTLSPSSITVRMSPAGSLLLRLPPPGPEGTRNTFFHNPQSLPVPETFTCRLSLPPRASCSHAIAVSNSLILFAPSALKESFALEESLSPSAAVNSNNCRNS